MMNHTGGMMAPSLSAGKQNNNRFWYFESIFLHTKALQSSEIQYELFNVVWNYIISVMKIEENQGKLRKIDWPAIRFLRKLQSWWHTWGAAFHGHQFKNSKHHRQLGATYIQILCAYCENCIRFLTPQKSMKNHHQKFARIRLVFKKIFSIGELC